MAAEVPQAALPPEAPAADAKTKLSNGALIAIIGGGVALLLIVAGVVGVPFVLRTLGGATSGGSSSGGPAAGASPEQVVEGYLTALSRGDAKGALKYVDSFISDKSLLTDKVLAASVKKAPIDDIEIGKAESGRFGAVEVPAEFTVGGEEVSRTFSVRGGVGDVEAQVMDGLVALSSYGFEGVGLQVNGVALADSTSAAVFPGRYELTIDNDAFTLDGEPTVVLVDDEDADALYDLRPVLSDDGIAQFRELVTASLNTCLAAKALTTPCGMSVADQKSEGYTPVDGTVTRTLTAEGVSTLAALKVEISDRAVVTSYDVLRVDITLEGQNAAGARAPFTVLAGSEVLQPKVDFASEKPTVIWE